MDGSDKLPTSEDHSDKSSDETKSDSTDDDSSSSPTPPHGPYQISFSNDPEKYYWVIGGYLLDTDGARSETDEVPLSDNMNAHSLPSTSDVPDLISFSDEPDHSNMLTDKDAFAEGSARNQTKSRSSTDKGFQRNSPDKVFLTIAHGNQYSTTVKEKYLDDFNCNRLLKLESEEGDSKPFVSDASGKVSLPAETPSTFTLNRQSLPLRQAPVNETTQSISSEIPCSTSADSESPNPETAYPGKKRKIYLTGSVSRIFGDCNYSSDLIHCSRKEKSPISKKDPEVSESITSGRQLKLKTPLLSFEERMTSNLKFGYGSLASNRSVKDKTKNLLAGNFPKTLPIDIESSDDESSSDSNSFEDYYDDDDINQFVEKETLAEQKAKEDCDSVSQLLPLPSDEHRENPKPESESLENLANSSATSEGTIPHCSSPLHERNSYEKGDENKPESTFDIEGEVIGDGLRLNESGNHLKDENTTEEPAHCLQENVPKEDVSIENENKSIDSDTEGFFVTEEEYLHFQGQLIIQETTLSESEKLLKDDDATEDPYNSLQRKLGVVQLCGNLTELNITQEEYIDSFHHLLYNRGIGIDGIFESDVERFEHVNELLRCIKTEVGFDVMLELYQKLTKEGATFNSLLYIPEDFSASRRGSNA